jgi:uncharacterized protein (DUF302 family)
MLSKTSKFALAAVGVCIVVAGPASAGGGAPFLIASRPAAAAAMGAPAAGSGVIRVKSSLSVNDTVAAIQADVAAKGIRFFQDIDQSQLASDAGIALRPSHLLVFGNPPLGIKFLTSNPYAGLDWPVRMLVTEDADGQVWVAWTDFSYIARRHRISNRNADFKMASEVAASIAASAAK